MIGPAGIVPAGLRRWQTSPSIKEEHMPEKTETILPPVGAITIYHPKHGTMHCMPEQLADMESEGWTKTKPEKKPADPTKP
jgi:hypothetical protein